jgi:serine protease Do
MSLQGRYEDPRHFPQLTLLQYSVLSTKYLVQSTIQSPALALVLLFLAASAPGQDSSSSTPGVHLAPQAFREATAKVRPSIVRIEGFGGVASAKTGGYAAPGEGPTTGLVISADGYIITSTFNFLRQPPVITIVRADGQRHVAQLLGRDETRKTCLLKVEGASGWPVPQFAAREKLKVGQWAVALGVGFGAAEPVLSAGIISATSRISGKAVQTDANTSPSNYGGPLIDLDGRVIGICVPLSPGGRETAAGAQWYDSGVGFAIPLDGLEGVLARLKAGDRLQHAFLGIRAKSYGDPPTGAEIEAVIANSPAATAGLVAKDRIVSLGGTDVLDVPHLATLIGRHVAGDSVEVAVDRSEVTQTFTVKLATPPPPPPPMPPPEPKDKAGKPRPKLPARPPRSPI